MYWIDCYAEEGKLFRQIESATQMNKTLYQNGSIGLHTYLVMKFRLMRLLDELEEAYDSIYEEIHSRCKEEDI